MIPDIQSFVDDREVVLDRVGVKDLRYPIRFKLRDNRRNRVVHCMSVADVSMSVRLPAEVRGTHMSRFISLLNDFHDDISLVNLGNITNRMLHLLGSDEGTLEIRFPIFVQKKAPVTGNRGLMDYTLGLVSDMSLGRYKLSIDLLVGVTTLCPCSKEIAIHGAHNQRSHVRVVLDHVSPDLDLLDLIEKIEAQGACQLYPLLKRSDEKYVTEKAYENPKFVEDLVRDVVLILEDNPHIHNFFEVESKNFESIHNHSAYALVKRRLMKARRK